MTKPKSTRPWAPGDPDAEYEALLKDQAEQEERSIAESTAYGRELYGDLFEMAQSRAESLGMTIQELYDRDRRLIEESDYPREACIRPFEVEAYLASALARERYEHVRACAACSALVEGAAPSTTGEPEWDDKIMAAVVNPGRTDEGHRAWLRDVLGGCAALVAILTDFARHGRSEPLPEEVRSAGNPAGFLQYFPAPAVAALAIGASLLVVWAVLGLDLQGPQIAVVNIVALWEQMGTSVKILMGVLVVMSMASVGVFFERLFTFIQATNQSKLFAPQVAKHLKDGKLKEAISVSQSKDYRYSHLGKVVLAGLQEYQFQQDSGVDLHKDDVVDSVHRAIQRAAALTSSDRRRGMGVLATLGFIVIFLGLMATTLGVINAVQGIAATVFHGLVADSVGVSVALIGTAIGLFVAIPAICFFNYLNRRLEYFAVEMDNSSSELVDYFIKKS